MQSVDYISNLKLRASYGIVGEQGVPAYNSLSRFTPYVTFLNNQVSNAVLLENLASSNLDWETTTQTDIGLEGEQLSKLSGVIEPVTDAIAAILLPRLQAKE